MGRAATTVSRKRQERISSGLSSSTKFKYHVHCMGCLSCAVLSPEDTGMYLCYSVIWYEITSLMKTPEHSTWGSVEAWLTPAGGRGWDLRTRSQSREPAWLFSKQMNPIYIICMAVSSELETHWVNKRSHSGKGGAGKILEGGASISESSWTWPAVYKLGREPQRFSFPESSSVPGRTFWDTDFKSSLFL